MEMTNITMMKSTPRHSFPRVAILSLLVGNCYFFACSMFIRVLIGKYIYCMQKFLFWYLFENPLI